MAKKKAVPSMGVSVAKAIAIEAALKSARATLTALEKGGTYKDSFKQTLKLINKALA